MRASEAVGELLVAVRAEQWNAPTPCSAWNVRGVVDHLVGVNLTFAALVEGGPMPARDGEHLGDDPIEAYRTSTASMLAAFARPGVLERDFSGATGADRLRLRLADLITHGWDLAQATGIPVELPDELAEQSLFFLEGQLAMRPRGAQFADAQPVDAAASALDRLAAFAGRSVPFKA
ncbi:TIGR03086 family metal-binding protein [Nocardia sp. NPDC049149]|uniref:TIGR03086 family metal-binding protein n=1 Tax=Nocardia sp. NPDC049149 TaxID=3364315 RepID=UPI003710BE52